MLGACNPSPLLLFVAELVGVCSVLLEVYCVVEDEVPGELALVLVLEEDADEKEDA